MCALRAVCERRARGEWKPALVEGVLLTLINPRQRGEAGGKNRTIISWIVGVKLSYLAGRRFREGQTDGVGEGEPISTSFGKLLQQSIYLDTTATVRQ